MTGPDSTARRVGMIVFAYYPDDPRVRRDAEALADAGMAVDVICLRKVTEAPRDTVHGVAIYRLPLKRERGSVVRYLWEYASFFLMALIRITVLQVRRSYDVVHVHNMPDVLVFCAAVPKLLGARVILDLHDPMPEVFMTKYGFGAGHRVIRTLRLLERWSIGFANRVLTPNKAFRDLFIARGCPAGKIDIIMNAPDERIFRPAGETGGKPAEEQGQFVLMYHGTIVERHGLDTAVHAVASLRESIPGLKLHVFGEGDFVEPFLACVKESGAEDLVSYHGHVPAETIAKAIAGINVGLIPNKRSVFTDINLPTRIFEYLSLGKSVVAPRTQGIQDYFDEASINFFEPGSAESLALAIRRVHDDTACRDSVLHHGMEVYNRHAWIQEKQRLLAIYRDVMTSTTTESAQQ